MVYYLRIQAAQWNKQKVFFDELNETLDEAMNKYDNFILAGGLNIDSEDKSKDTNNYLCHFMDTFSLNNLIKVKTCYKSTAGTILSLQMKWEVFRKLVLSQQALVTDTKWLLPV